jgi:serine/threonine protein kinase
MLMGFIMGTAAYMSPEQAKGKPVDKRSDIWAFGCVLYEMLTGRAAFEEDDVPEILSRVLQRDPDWTRLPSDLPASIPKLLRLCLQKDVKKRRQAAGDVRIQTVRGEQVTTRTIFHFRDRSLYDETAVFSQRGTYGLLSYHVVQRGPTFASPDNPATLDIDMSRPRDRVNPRGG